jgi:hypothetical protein
MDDVPVPDTANADDGRLLLVPRVPGPLLAVDLAMGRPRDDLDLMIDDLFGDPVEERSGVIDVVLVIAGVALLLWTALGATPIAGIVGVVALVLGLALPTRDALRRLRGRRIAARLERARAQGLLLDVSAPETLHLAGTYRNLLAVAGGIGGEDGAAAVAAGHLAMTEVATLLRGAPPHVPAEAEYVDRRDVAIGGLADALSGVLWHAARREAAERADAEQEVADHAARVAVAREELDTVGGLGSLAQLDALSSLARRGSVDAPA